MKPTLAEQIEYQEGQIRHMERSLPRGVACGAVTKDHADKKMECARAILADLITKRDAARQRMAIAALKRSGVSHG